MTVNAARGPRPVSLDDKYALDTARAYMTGIEALVRLPMLQHQRDLRRGLNTAAFVSGYRGSPLGGVDQAFWKAKPWTDRHNVHFQPGVNEELAATAVWGSQQTGLFEGARYDGVFAMWYGKGPGVDRSMDVFKHANAFGTSKYGGVLAVAGDDHACKSSTLPHQSEHNFIAASMPVLSPANVQEVLDLGIFGWELSRYSGCWVALKAITENMDSAISADIDPARIQIAIPEGFELPEGGVHARWPDRPMEQEERLNRYKIYAAREFARVNGLNRVVLDSPCARFGIITSGKAYLDVMQALEDIGITTAVAAEIGLRVYKVGMPWPLEPQVTHDFADGLEEILVVEEKRSVIEDQLTGQLYNYPVAARPRVVGEFDEDGRDLLPNRGELTPAIVALAIAARIRRFYRSEVMDERIAWIERKEASLARPVDAAERVPHFCSGCPHNTSTKLPDGSFAMGGIGCHYMATWMPDRPTLTFTQMGGEGVTWIGQAPFTDTPHMFQNLGDGTYFHSGILAVRAAVASGVNITYKILYNDAVAMTGGQPIDGSLTVPDLLRQLSGEGVRRIALVSDEPDQWRGGRMPALDGLTLHHRDEMDALQRELREGQGTSVIVYQQTCAAEKRRRRKKGELADPPKRLFINDAVCEGCGDCSVQSNCLSIVPKETELGRKRRVDQSACNKDYSCNRGFCPSFVTVVGGELRKPKATNTGEVVFDPLPEPSLPDLRERPWNTVVTGVGGTGVLTISALVAMAAHIEGKGCATLNQTGLAQKFGAVVSHVRVALQQDAIYAVRIPAGEADLLLGCDLVVTTTYDALGKVARGRSHAVVNDTEVPTAEFIRNPDASFPTSAMQRRISEEVGEDDCHFLDATRIATALLGDSIAANLFLLGVAYQRGLVPVSAAALEAAIAMNGVAIDFNKQACLYGRRYAHRPEQVLALVPAQEERRTQTVEKLIEDRVQRLTDYQDASYAQRFRESIERIAAVDPQSEEQDSLTATVARSLYKLMAYKDEYEVARLYTSPEFTAALEAQFDGDYELRFNLAPPLLGETDASGQPRKREFGAWMMTAFRLLAPLRKLRGTPFDIFGYTEERREERRDIERFEALLGDLVPRVGSANYATLRELLALPRQLRGYGHVKARNRAQLDVRRAELLRRLEEREDPVRIVEAA
ncbi:MAG: indolepyruvate ferredoxin oxidoreductase family protein [Pseudomonadota bacterium]